MFCGFQLDNLDDQLQEKDDEIGVIRNKLTSYHADQSSTDSAVSSLEESLSDKDKQIDKYVNNATIF